MPQENKQPLIAQIQTLEQQIIATRKTADKVVNYYQTQRKEFNDWLARIKTEYLEKRAEKNTQIEIIRQQLAKIRSNFKVTLHELREDWVRQLGETSN